MFKTGIIQCSFVVVKPVPGKSQVEWDTSEVRPSPRTGQYSSVIVLQRRACGYRTQIVCFGFFHLVEKTGKVNQNHLSSICRCVKFWGRVIWLSRNTFFSQLPPLALAETFGSAPPLRVGVLHQSQGSNFHPGSESVMAGLLFYPPTASFALFSYVYLYQSPSFYKVKKKIGKHRCFCCNSIWKPTF